MFLPFCLWTISAMLRKLRSNCPEKSFVTFLPKIWSIFGIFRAECSGFELKCFSSPLLTAFYMRRGTMWEKNSKKRFSDFEWKCFAVWKNILPHCSQSNNLRAQETFRCTLLQKHCSFCWDFELQFLRLWAKIFRLRRWTFWQLPQNWLLRDQRNTLREGFWTGFWI